MKKIMIVLFTVVAVGGFQGLYAQEVDQNASETPDKEESVEPVKNVIYFELFGNGIFYSFNYERRLDDKIWVRGGISRVGIFRDSDFFVSPVTLSYLFGSSVVTFETGAGLGFFYGSMPERLFANENEENIVTGFGIFTTGTFGARFQPETHNLFMKLAFTPMYVPGELIFPSFGFSMGYSF